MTVALLLLKGLMTIDRIPLTSPILSVTIDGSTISLSPLVTAVIDTPPHSFDIDMNALMQAAVRITQKIIQQAVKQIFLKRIQLGSIMNGSNSSYVKLVVTSLMLLLLIAKEI